MQEVGAVFMSNWFKFVCFAAVALLCVALSQVVWNGQTTHSKIVKPTYVNSLGMEFVKIPGGKFQMGSDELEGEQPVHSVTLSDFYLMSTEVTNRQFSVFKKTKRPVFSASDDMPVVNITRAEMDAFAAWLGQKDGKKYSLPTEAQWEYAARGGTANLHFHWGNTFDPRLANIGSSGAQVDGQAAKVKSYPPNQYGIYDMIGNVSETVYDGYYDYTDRAAIDPRNAPPKDAVSGIERGQGIGSYFVWLWKRMPYDQNSRNWGVGFRLVVELDH